VPPDPVLNREAAGLSAVGAADADSVFSGQLGEAAAVLQVLAHKPHPTPLGQAGIGVALHEGVRSGLVGRTSTRSGLKPHCH